MGLAFTMAASVTLSGCGTGKNDSGKTEIELVQYKPEAVKAFEKLEEKFNATHDDIHLTIESPNDAMTVLKTRFIREDNPDIIGIGGDVNFSNFIDSDMLMDISDYQGLDSIKDAYKEIDKALEFVPEDGVYAVPYVANAAGILYNRELFKEHGWQIPATWDEFMSLCQKIQDAGIQPLYFGFKDTWTCLAPWNSISVDLAPSDVCRQVNQGKTTFEKEYKEVAERMLELIQYGPDDPFAYDYNGACTAFAKGEAAMYPIGSYAIPQIQSVNPDMDIDSFVTPASNDPSENKLNSGVDLQFCVMNDCENKEAAYEVLDFLLEDENVQTYLDDQKAVPCKEGDFTLPATLDGMNQQRSRSDQDTPDHGFHCKGFVQKYKCENQRNDHAQFINRHHFGCLPDLQCPIITKPGRPGCKSGKNQKQPALFADLGNTALGMCQKNHSPCHHNNHHSPDRCCKVGIHAINADLRKNGGKCRKYCR